MSTVAQAGACVNKSGGKECRGQKQAARAGLENQVMMSPPWEPCLRALYEQARNQPPGVFPPRQEGVSEARARYWEWRGGRAPRHDGRRDSSRTDRLQRRIWLYGLQVAVTMTSGEAR